MWLVMMCLIVSVAITLPYEALLAAIPAYLHFAFQNNTMLDLDIFILERLALSMEIVERMAAVFQLRAVRGFRSVERASD